MLQKTWLDECLKSTVSDDPLSDNMANGLKHCSNLKDSACTIYINHCDSNCVEKSLFR